MKHKFDYKMKTIGQINGLVTTEDIINEPMLFGADVNFAYKNSGPLTKNILNKLTYFFSTFYSVKEFEKLKISIDTKITQTVTGQYTSIPDYHCDFVPRSEKYSQPDLSKITDEVRHYMCILSDQHGHSCTEFVIDKPTFEFDYDSDIPIWGQLDKQIKEGEYKTKFIKPGEILQFDQNSIHRASPTQNPGWRFFFRLSTGKTPVNQIRKQVQIYTPIGLGW